jgi:hypothetical protein
MVNIAFKHFPGDDLDDFVQRIEKSFDIKFEPFELTHVKTLNELRDHLIIKMKDNLSLGCTTQQAFYKLKVAIEQVTGISSISPKTMWADLLPVENRRRTINEVESILGFGLNILQPKTWIISLLTVTLLASLITLFFDWKFALLGLVASIAGFYIADYFGKELKFKTVREAA